MNRVLAVSLLLAALVSGARAAAPSTRDSVYAMYADKNYAAALPLIERLVASAVAPEQRLAAGLELGDYYLDKTDEYSRAESVYAALAEAFPKHRQLPDVLYRLAIAQELQEEFLDAARNYEKVATRYSKSTYGTDALDAIERCFRKNYQDRVAYVNGYPITRIELDDRISRNPNAYAEFEKKQGLVDTMVDTRLLYEAALAAGVKQDPTFQSGLGDYRNRVLFSEWYEREVTAKSEPNERELKAAYKKNLPRYTTAERVQAYRILVETKPVAESLRALLLADTSLSWDTVAKANSKAPDRDRGGDLGLFARGVQPKPVEDAAFKLRVGQISQPIQVEDGYAIIKVTKKTPKTVRTYDEAKGQLAVEIKQERSGKRFEQAVAELKSRANVVEDSAALAEERETLAVVDGVPLTRPMLDARLATVPPMFRGQFETPEGRKRMLDQLVLERLLLREVERGKYWLANRAMDQLISRRATMLTDTYKRQRTTDQAQPDSAALMAAYKASIKDFKEPTKAHAREMVAATRIRAGQLRRWAVAGRIPAMVSGRAVLVVDSAQAVELHAALGTSPNTDSIVSLGALAYPPAALTGRPVIGVAGRNVPDLGKQTDLNGPFVKGPYYAFAFTDLLADAKLHSPALVPVETPEALRQLTGPQITADSPQAESARLGAYVRLEQTLPSSFVRSLFKLDTNGMASLQRVPGGWLVVKVTKLDTAQTVDFAELIRRYSTSGTRWSGGELWLTRDDKSRDKRIVQAAYSLPKGGYSDLIRLNDSTFTFVKLEEIKKAYTRSFSEVRNKLEPKLRREKETRLYGDLIASLRREAKIEIVMKPEDFLPEPGTETEPVEPEPGTGN